MSAAAPEIRLAAWTGLDGARAAAGAWRALAARAGLDPLCNDPDWALAYAEAFVEPSDAFGWTATARDGRALGVLALRREPSRGALALRRALFLADGTFDSDYLDLALEPGLERALLDALLDALAHAGEVEAVVLAGVPDRARALAALREALDARGLPRRERPVAALSAPLPPSFDAYVDGLRPRMRSKLRQALRTADEAGLCFAWCDAPDELDARLATLYDLHERRWRAAGKPGSYGDPRRRAFTARVARDALARGELRLARLDRAGETLAIQLGIARGATYYQVQEGFDPAGEELRAPTALRALAIRELIGQGARAYDFMAGDARHKRDWGGEPRPCTTIAFALPNARARAAYGLRAWIDRRRNGD